jgi:branched-chain amino acid transport system permease protein
MMIGSALGQHIVNGLTLGCMYALIALGYTLIFGVMRLIFFAQGDLCMVGAFGALGAVLAMGGHPPGGLLGLLVIALVAAIVASVSAGVLAERFAIMPLRRAARTKQLIASLGVSMILQNLVLLKVSAENMPFPRLFPDSGWNFAGAILTPVQLFIVAGSFLLMGALHWFLVSTRTGLHIRAVAESSETAELDGINIRRAVTLTFVIGSVLAGFAGVMMASYDGVAKYNMGFLPGIKGFTAAIIGGFGRPGGAMIGGLVLGLAETFAAGYLSSTYKDVIAFALLVLVILVRPSGLLGKGWASA